MPNFYPSHTTPPHHTLTLLPCYCYTLLLYYCYTTCTPYIVYIYLTPVVSSTYGYGYYMFLIVLLALFSFFFIAKNFILFLGLNLKEVHKIGNLIFYMGSFVVGAVCM